MTTYYVLAVIIYFVICFQQVYLSQLSKSLSPYNYAHAAIYDDIISSVSNAYSVYHKVFKPQSN